MNKYFIDVPGELSLKDWKVFIATWGGSGLAKKAPGTMGSLAAIPVGMLLQYFFGIPGLLVGIFLCIWIGTDAVHYYMHQTGREDPPEVVVDETLGMWIAAIPAATHWQLWLLAFALFRFFDIKKPWPCSFYDKKRKGAWSVMMDDLFAGLYALLGTSMGALMLF